jgi:hypothetical protein
VRGIVATMHSAGRASMRSIVGAMHTTTRTSLRGVVGTVRPAGRGAGGSIGGGPMRPAGRGAVGSISGGTMRPAGGARVGPTTRGRVGRWLRRRRSGLTGCGIGGLLLCHRDSRDHEQENCGKQQTANQAPVSCAPIHLQAS